VYVGYVKWEHTDHPPCLEGRNSKKTEEDEKEKEKKPGTNWGLLQQFLDLQGFG
jgi:hypothetical protein